VEVKNYVPRSYPKSPSETKFLTEALLGNNFIFSSLPTSHSKLMIDAMEMKEYAMADEIIIQGDTGKCREQVSNTLKQTPNTDQQNVTKPILLTPFVLLNASPPPNAETTYFYLMNEGTVTFNVR
jgi:hypothetical protein